MLENEDFKITEIEIQKEYFNIKLYDKEEKFEFWLECHITKDNYAKWKFKQHIFHTYDSFDMFFENYQEQIDNIDRIDYFVDYFNSKIIDYVKKGE